MNEPNSNVDFMSKGIAFFTFTSTQSTPYTLIISNIKTPPIVGTFKLFFHLIIFLFFKRSLGLFQLYCF